MALSIRSRTLLAMNLLVLGLAALLAWLAGLAAARVVEERLARDMARNTAAFLQERHLPCTDAVLRDLHRIFAAEFAAVDAASGAVLATSLPAALRPQLAVSLADAPPDRRLRLGGQPYRVATEPLGPAATGPAVGGGTGGAQLYVLLPLALVADARAGAFRGTLLAAVPAVLVATALATWLAATVTRPLRRLAAEMDTLAAEAVAQGRTEPAPGPAVPACPRGRGRANGNGRALRAGASRSPGAPSQALPVGSTTPPAPPPPPGARPRPGSAGPGEIRRLTDSFHRLLAELRQAEARLDRQRRLAEVGSLAARLAHDLKNPLSGIAMNVRVLQDELARAGIDDPGLAVIRTEVERMDLYLQQLLLLARGPQAPAAGTASPGGTDLAAVLRSVLALLAARCEHAGVSVVCTLEKVPPARGDTEPLRQVALNLLLNALEAMPGGGTLTVRLGPGAADRLRVEVCDTGGGVRVPAGTDIFDPFVSTKPGGAGLGLYTCRCVLEPYGGTLAYENRGPGACFWFELPAAGGGAEERP